MHQILKRSRKTFRPQVPEMERDEQVPIAVELTEVCARPSQEKAALGLTIIICERQGALHVSQNEIALWNGLAQVIQSAGHHLAALARDAGFRAAAIEIRYGHQQGCDESCSR